MFSKLKDWKSKGSKGSQGSSGSEIDPEDVKSVDNAEEEKPVASKEQPGLFQKLKGGGAPASQKPSEDAAMGRQVSPQTNGNGNGNGGGLFNRLKEGGKRSNNGSKEGGSDEQDKGGYNSGDSVERVDGSMGSGGSGKESMFARLKRPKTGSNSSGDGEYGIHSHESGEEPPKEAAAAPTPAPALAPALAPAPTGGLGAFARLKGSRDGSREGSKEGSRDEGPSESAFAKLKKLSNDGDAEPRPKPAPEPTQAVAPAESPFAKLKGKKGSQASSEEEEMQPFTDNKYEAPQQVEAKPTPRKMEDPIIPVVPAASTTSPGLSGDAAKSQEGSDEGEVFDDEEDIEIEEEEEVDDRAQTSGMDIEVHKFDELVLEPQTVADTQNAWNNFCTAVGSREAAGEAIYGALFDGAPALQSLFTTPRAVQAMRFMNGLNGFVKALDRPPNLKILVETLGFGHLNLDVTVPRVVIFRDAILDLFEVELGEIFTSSARSGWKALLNYVGGAIIFVKTHYADRLRIISFTWHEANKGDIDQQEGMDSQGGSQEDHNSKRDRAHTTEEHSGDEYEDGSGEHVENKKKKKTVGQANVPTTFKEMFQFNLAIMGFGHSEWMTEILLSFDAIVKNVSNSARLQEECEILALRISKASRGQINLGEYKSCMLASLRSLLPKIWEPTFEVAWSWLWENVERILQSLLGNPPIWEKALYRLLASNKLDENARYELRAAIYARFFDLAPVGQDYFKQSNTRLHFIADRVFQMTTDIFKNPADMVEEISALGLRHVGYAIPTELIGPFVTACVEILATATKDEMALEAFRWSLGLISKILVRTITEGSTIVMKAINANSTKLLKKAVSCAPRANRGTWLLLVQVGSQKISPLLWAIESGSLEAAGAIIVDLLTIRADRERYYYGVDELFHRHPDIIMRLTQDAPTLLPILLAGLIWRSRLVKNGFRRVNYYVKHLLVTHNGGVSQALQWLAASKDVKIIAHPIIAFVSDTYWSGVVRRQFTLSKIWFVLSLLIFLLSQAILPKYAMDATMSEVVAESEQVRWTILIMRGCIYAFTLLRLISFHTRRTFRQFRKGQFGWVLVFPVPSYLREKLSACSFILMLMLAGMLATEPMVHCLNHKEWPTELCKDAEEFINAYSVFSMTGMVILWGLVIDLSVFSTKLSAFVLVCGHVLQEVGRFMVALMFLLLTFASAVCVLKTQHEEYESVPSAVISLFAVTVGVYEKDYRELSGEPVLLGALFLFFCASGVLLLNLLIAQLNCSYEFVYADMVGFARMNRANLIVETLVNTPEARWKHFVYNLGLDTPVEFDEGDIGPPGAMQVIEAASAHAVLVDQILRFGGSTAGDQPWPEDTLATTTDEEAQARFERIEDIVQRALKRIAGKEGKEDHDDEEQEQMDSSMVKQESGKFSASEDGSDVSLMDDLGDLDDDE